MAVSLGVSYFGNRYPNHARVDLQAIRELGASYVVHVMSEADLRWNPGTIRQLVAIGRELGLEGWLAPWGVAGVFGGEAPSYDVAAHPAAWQVDNQGTPLPALCPRQPAFRRLLETWLDAAAASGATVAMWDEPHLAVPRSTTAGRWACRCLACRTAFAARFGHEMPTELTPEVDAFVDDLLAETLAWLVAGAKARGLGSAVVLLADAAYDAAAWRTAAALPGVQYFGSTPYWFLSDVSGDDMPAYVRGWGERVVAATAGTPAEPLAWVQAFQVPAGREVEIETAVAALVETGVRSVAVWSYLACVAMSELAADDPDAAWAAVTRAFRRVRGAGRETRHVRGR